jgi:6,7-dimethyl-8-ribityllumazine synthase
VSTASFSFDFTKHLNEIKQFKMGITWSIWNEDITSRLLDGATQELIKLGVLQAQIITLPVPGAFELPWGAQQLFESKSVDAVLTLGCVIKGDTPHFDFVCDGATHGVLNVGLKYNKPCVFGLITTLNQEQAEDRVGGKHGHKGIEAAQTAIFQLLQKRQLQ